MRALWTWLWVKTSRLTFAVILFVAGVVVWGGLNTAMEATNTLTFCIGCHEMRDNVYVEYKETIHYQNQHGVRTICSDCHVPDSWGPKVVRKIKASKELYHWMLGTIDTTEKYEAKRLELAQKVWHEMKENNSQECRNCHAYTAMHWEKMESNRARKEMQAAQKTDMACVECHKGVAHKLPNMEKEYERLTVALKADGGQPSASGKAYPTTVIKMTGDGGGMEPEDIAEIMPMTELQVLEVQGDKAKVRLSAWDREGGSQLFVKPGPLIQVGKLGFDGIDMVKPLETVIDKETELEWHRVEVTGWVPTEGLVTDHAALEAYAEHLWKLDCNLCHQLYPTEMLIARDWEKNIKAMRRFTKLDENQQQVVLKYMQVRAKNVAAN